MKQLQDKTAIITGGSKGIGKSVSKALSNAGATVFILDIDEDNGLQTVNEITSLNNKAYFYKINVASKFIFCEPLTTLLLQHRFVLPNFILNLN